jgi:hypothetical protein
MSDCKFIDKMSISYILNEFDVSPICPNLETESDDEQVDTDKEKICLPIISANFTTNQQQSVRGALISSSRTQRNTSVPEPFALYTCNKSIAARVATRHRHTTFANCTISVKLYAPNALLCSRKILRSTSAQQGCVRFILSASVAVAANQANKSSSVQESVCRHCQIGAEGTQGSFVGV